MIFNDSFLFLHVPKTGGMAASKYLLGACRTTTYYSIPDLTEPVENPHVRKIAGKRHETLEEARGVLAARGLDVLELPLILSTIRNPYELEVSRYAYLRLGQACDKGPNQDLALSSSFERFALHSFEHAGRHRPIHSYFLLDGLKPANLKVLRAESLAEDLAAALEQVGLCSELPLARINESPHGAWENFYTPAAENAVFERYRWIFEEGYYPRRPGGLPF